jgi:DNA polymerase III delta subunit
MAAAPNPEEELRRLAAAVEKRLPGCILLLGKARWFKDRAARLVIDRVAARGGDVIQLAGDQSQDARPIRDLRTASLFGGPKVLLVREPDKWLKAVEAPLLDAITKLPPQHALVLDAEKLDGRTKLSKTLTQAGQVFQFRDLYERPYRMGDDPASGELVRWLVDRGRTHHLKLSPAAGLFLVQTVGADPSRLDEELSRLRRGLEGVEGVITPELLHERVEVGFSSTQFLLAEAVLARDLNSALRSLDALEREGLEDAAGRSLESSALFPLVSSWLHRSLLAAAKTRRLIDQGEDPATAATRAGVVAYQDRFLAAVRKQKRTWFERGLVALARCERRLRESGEEPVPLLERMVIELIGTRR